MYYIAVAAGAALPLDEPATETILMEDVVAHWNFHEFFAVDKVLQAHAALSLLGHIQFYRLVIKLILIAFWIILKKQHQFIKSYSLNYIELNLGQTSISYP